MGSLGVYRSGFHPVPSSKLLRALFKSLPQRLDKKNFNFGPECCNQSVPDIARGIAKAKNILVMAGAGMSTPSGIPDFRSPGRKDMALKSLPTPKPQGQKVKGIKAK